MIYPLPHKVSVDRGSDYKFVPEYKFSVPEPKRKLSPAATAAIIAGVIFGAVAIGVALYLSYKRKSNVTPTAKTSKRRKSRV